MFIPSDGQRPGSSLVRHMLGFLLWPPQSGSRIWSPPAQSLPHCREPPALLLHVPVLGADCPPLTLWSRGLAGTDHQGFGGCG